MDARGIIIQVIELYFAQLLIFGMTWINGEQNMNEVTIGISNRETASERFLATWESGQPQGAYIEFESAEQLWKTLTIKRWQILKTMTGTGELSIREVARRVERDVKAVHRDITSLLNCGLLDRTDNGRIVFPYDTVHVDFLMSAA